jgi:hypothetical protein
MATYDNLPVYKACYDLLLLLFRESRNMQRDYRFTLGESMKKELITLMLNVYRANCVEQKKALLMSARENLEVTRLLLRLSNDLKQISTREFALSNLLIESISKQLTAWSKKAV